MENMKCGGLEYVLNAILDLLDYASRQQRSLKPEAMPDWKGTADGLACCRTAKESGSSRKEELWCGLFSSFTSRCCFPLATNSSRLPSADAGNSGCYRAFIGLCRNQEESSKGIHQTRYVTVYLKDFRHCDI